MSASVKLFWVTLLVTLFYVVFTSGAIYTNQYAVHLHGGMAEADRLASKYGYINFGQIGTLEDHYLFVHKKVAKRSLTPSQGEHTDLHKEPGVHWIEQQAAKSRVKRGYTATFTDPKYQLEQWYFNRDDDLNMNIIEAWNMGYTGKGVVVTILDDGIERDHPDLVANYDPDASTDINNHDSDPMPRPTFNDENRHGTRCAGEVAMQANNSVCGVGAAFNAKIGGIRMLDGMVTDSVEAESLSFSPQHVDIYSASWGPDDDGKTVDGPGRLAQKAFVDGVTKGRDGKGSIFMWASGNGGRGEDNCNCDGYQDSIYTISISSATEHGEKPWYSEECSSTLATTYSSGSFDKGDREISTTDLHHKCTFRHTGTSASAPLAAGMMALLLEANPALTWRDVQHIIVRTSRRGNLIDPNWVTNGDGYDVSHKYGFGLLDGGAMVKLAKVWKTVPEQRTCQSEPDSTRRRTPATATVDTTGCTGTNDAITHLEHVQVKISTSFSRRGDFAIYLTSPSGTKSDLLKPRSYDHTSEGLSEWVFMTTHNWGEKASGRWTLEVISEGSSFNEGVLLEWTLILYGTNEPVNPELRRGPLESANGKIWNTTKHPKVRAQDDDPDEDSWSSYDEYSDYDKCDEQCLDGCDGPGPADCWTCKNYKNRDTLECVEECGPGHYAPDLHHRCRRCDDSCATCNGPTASDCLSCPEDTYLVGDASICVDSCESRVGYYLDDSQSCSPCNRECETCLGSADFCLSCVDGRELHGTECLIGCPPQSYKDEDDICQRCHEACWSCYGPSDENCLQCMPDYIMQENRCIMGESCSVGYYRDTDSYPPECRQCHTGCDTCSGPGEDECLECSGDFHLNEGRCLTTCTIGQYLDGGVCRDCYDWCSACEGSNEDQCLQCFFGSFLKDSRCVADCGPGYYGYNGECRLCNPSCTKCQGGDVTDCLECAQEDGEQRFLQEGLCVDHCSTGYYGDEETLECWPCHESCWSCSGPRDNDCVECPPDVDLVGGSCEEAACYEDCKTCTLGLPNQCTSCFNGYYLQDHRCSLGASSCPEGTFADRDHNECHPCHPTCQTCSERHHDSCTTCDVSYFLTADNTCESECPDGTFIERDTDGGHCEDCHPNCQTCFGAGHSKCVTCVEDRYFSDNNCVLRCDDDQFADEENRVCIPCHRSCATCTGPTDYDCLSCESNLNLYHGRCVSTCSDGQYQSSDSTCEFCDDSCDTCTGPSPADCLRCNFAFFLTSDGTCKDRCDSGFYEDYSSGICQTCHPTCSECLGSSESDCLSCTEDLFLYGGMRCVEHCPEGFFADSRQCEPCSLECGDCIEERDKCVSCIAYTYLFEDESTHRCVDMCPTGYTEDDDSNRCIQTSVLCPVYCESCDEDTGACTMCVEGFTLRNGICYTTEVDCDVDGSFLMWSDGKWVCADCDASCRACVGPTEYDCTACHSGSILEGGKCAVQCYEGEYIDDKSSRCEACHASCESCDGPSATDCITCRHPYHLDDGICRSQCPTRQFEISGDCRDCNGNCATCDGPGHDDCLSCSPPKVWKDFTCVDECPDGFYGNHVEDVDGQIVQECRRCHINCKTCHGPTPDECKECEQHLLKKEHECVTECGSGFYTKDGECRACHVKCQECSGPEINKCLSCPNDTVLQDNLCVDECKDKYYLEKAISECLQCHPSCQKCNGPGAADCVKCNHNDMLIDGVCYPRCQAGYYYSGDANDTNMDSQDCQLCDGTCKECKGPGPKNCLECEKPRVHNKKSHRCVLCCDPNSVENDDDECCNCHPDTGECLYSRSLAHVTRSSNKKVIGLVTVGVMAIIAVFLAIFGILQCRSKKTFCFSRHYHKLPTYYESNSEEVRMSKDYQDDDVEIYTKDDI